MYLEEIIVLNFQVINAQDLLWFFNISYADTQLSIMTLMTSRGPY